MTLRALPLVAPFSFARILEHSRCELFNVATRVRVEGGLQSPRAVLHGPVKRVGCVDGEGGLK